MAAKKESHKPHGRFSRDFLRPLAAVLIPLAFSSQLVFAQENTSQDTPSSKKGALEKLQRTQQNLQRIKKQAEGISQNVSSLEKERITLKNLLLQTAKKIQRGEAALSKIEGRMDELAEQEQLIRGSIAQRHGTIAEMLAAMQRMGRQPPPLMVTRRDDALKMVRSAMLLSSVFPQLNAQAQRLTGELTELVRVMTTIQTQAAALRNNNQNLVTERKKMETLLATKKSKLTERQTALASLQRTADEQARTVSSLQQLVTRLDETIAKKEEIARYEKELANPSNKTKKAGKTIKGAKRFASLGSPGRLKPAIPFREARGLLPLPASGKRLTKYGERNSLGVRNEGFSILTRFDAQITSPSDGWVVYSGPFRSYGQLLIINAGGGYHVLLAGMTHVDATVGQFVLAGEPVARMGADRQAAFVGNADGTKIADQSGEDGAVLYVEFRKDGRPINPAPWWVKAIANAQG